MEIDNNINTYIIFYIKTYKICYLFLRWFNLNIKILQEKTYDKTLRNSNVSGYFSNLIHFNGTSRYVDSLYFTFGIS